MRVRLRVLREAILADLAELGELEAEAAQLAAVDAPERHHVRALGSVLHDWYGGLEKALKRIVDTLDGTVASGSGRHQRLLEQVSLEIPEVRPAVLDADLAEQLRDLLGFRHVFRNVYGSRLRWDRLCGLAHDLAGLHPRVGAALERFGDHLEQVARGI